MYNKMPSLRSKVAAYKARSRFAARSALYVRRALGRITRASAPSRPRGFRARLKKYNVHAYKRYATPTTIDTSVAATSYDQTVTFDLSQVRGSSELTALYDQYMITGVKVMFQLVTNPDSGTITNNSVTANATNFYPKLMYVRDYDNNTIETPNELRERNSTTMRVLRPNQIVSVFLRPAVRNNIYLDGVTPASSPIWNQWIDCSTTQVPHYGLKYCVDNLGHNAGQSYRLRVEYQYFIKFKNVR